MFSFQLAFMEIHMQQMDHIDAIRWLDTDVCAYMAERSLLKLYVRLNDVHTKQRWSKKKEGMNKQMP